MLPGVQEAPRRKDPSSSTARPSRGAGMTTTKPEAAPDGVPKLYLLAPILWELCHMAAMGLATTTTCGADRAKATSRGYGGYHKA